MTQEKKVRVGVIGIGFSGRELHLKNYKQCPNAEVVAIVDDSVAKLRRAQNEYQIPYFYTDYERLLEDEKIDAVSIATPNFLHAPITIRALSAGKHVLVEKPMATTVADAEKMLIAAQKANRILMPHFNCRFWPENVLIKRCINQGFLGAVNLVKAVSFCPYNAITALPKWRCQKLKAGGGAFYEVGAHGLDLGLFMLGYPEIQEIQGFAYPELLESLSLTIIKFKTGQRLYHETYGFSNEFRHVVHVFGTERHISTLTISPQEVSAAKTENPQQHFVNCIQNGTKPICTAEQGLTVQKILAAVVDNQPETRK